MADTSASSSQAAATPTADRRKFQELQATATATSESSQHYVDAHGNSIEAATATDGSAASSSSSTNAPPGQGEDAVGEELVQWLESCGADSKKLRLQQYAPEVRGVHSEKVLVPGERILAIPKQCLITVEMGKRTEIGQKLLARNLEFVAPKHIFLMMFLLTDMEDVRGLYVCVGGRNGPWYGHDQLTDSWSHGLSSLGRDRTYATDCKLVLQELL